MGVPTGSDCKEYSFIDTESACFVLNNLFAYSSSVDFTHRLIKVIILM